MSIKTITVFVDGGSASDARLAAACEMALKHDPEQRWGGSGNLGDDAIEDLWLLAVVFVAVGMAAVDQDWAV